MGRGFRRAKKRAARMAHKGPCYVKGCARNGGSIHSCITCEKIVMEKAGVSVSAPSKEGVLAVAEAFKTGRIFYRQCCDVHNEQGLAEVKQHALVKHPANLLRVIGAGLKGEEI